MALPAKRLFAIHHSMRPESSTGLYWSIRGSVLCAQHAGEIDDERWIADAWEPLPPSSQGGRGAHYQCRRCSPDGTTLRRAPA
jgi:hypothetical protein